MSRYRHTSALRVLAPPIAAGVVLCLMLQLPAQPARAVGPDIDTAVEPSSSQATQELTRRLGLSERELARFLTLVALTYSNEGNSAVQAIGDAVAGLRLSNVEDDLNAAPVPTGDPLFDRLALAIDHRLRTLAPEDSGVYEYLGALEDAELASWEAEFGSDCRYWELRYLCAKYGPAGVELAQGYSHPVEFLAVARQRGCASANTLLLLYQELSTSGQADLALLNEAVAAGPDEAWPYYERGLYWSAQGDEDRALADLAAGNAAPKLEPV